MIDGLMSVGAEGLASRGPWARRLPPLPGPPGPPNLPGLCGVSPVSAWHINPAELSDTLNQVVQATGAPLGPDNAPMTDFEKEAVRAMNAGKPYLERVVGEGEGRRLLAATLVPAVMQKCTDCHGRKVGEVLGFIRYDLKVK